MEENFKILNDILKELNQSTQEIVETILIYTEDQFNTKPYQDSWSAAQVIEHLLKSEYGIIKTLQGNAVTSKRKPDEKIEAIKSLFLDFTIKMKSPEFSIPSNEVRNKEMVYTQFKSHREEFEKMTDTIDLSMLFTDFPFPTLGELTGLEWLSFMICHSQRHIEQLKTINKTIATIK